MLELVDSHCHLDFSNFNGDREEVVLRAVRRGVVAIVNSGYDFRSNERSLEVSRKFEIVSATLGLSPNRIHVEDYRTVIDQITDYEDEIVGIGEVGLDLLKARVGLNEQKKVFVEFLKLAEELDKPVVIHARKAENIAYDIVRNYDVVAVFHCYSGSEAVMKNIVDAGHYVSLSTLVYFSEKHKKLARVVELDNLLLETDSPFLSPFRGRNEPGNVYFAAESVAKVKGVELDEVAERTTRNAQKVFKI